MKVLLLAQKPGPVDPQKIARRMPGSRLEQDSFEITFDPSEKADIVLVLNRVSGRVKVTARSGYVWRWDREPIIKSRPDNAFDRIYSHQIVPNDDRFILAPPNLDWWVGKSFDELVALKPPTKTKHLSAITSTKSGKANTMHNLRAAFIEELCASFPQIDLFGRGRDYELDDKWDGLAGYKYSIALENFSKADYWTEKISDCFLSFTVPLYFGATNISKFFPDKSYIWLPMDDLQAATRVIEKLTNEDDWEERLPALQEARELILHKYSMYSFIDRESKALSATFFSAPHRTKTLGSREPGGVLQNILRFVKN